MMNVSNLIREYTYAPKILWFATNLIKNDYTHTITLGAIENKSITIVFWEYPWLLQVLK